MLPAIILSRKRQMNLSWKSTLRKWDRKRSEYR